jgi:hypothetical protein
MMEGDPEPDMPLAGTPCLGVPASGVLLWGQLFQCWATMWAACFSHWA